MSVAIVVIGAAAIPTTFREEESMLHLTGGGDGNGDKLDVGDEEER